jgi:phosphoribosyl-ATP pyrophosphohydrolase
MIIPSVDLQGGQTVQLVGGEELAVEAGDPRPIADRFGRVGEVAVIDLDAARSRGSNGPLVSMLLERARCRVGGGIRDAATAIRWLDAGAEKVILGTAARAEVLCKLPRERVIAALDAIDDEVVVDGWVTRTGHSIVDRMQELRDYVGGFLVTFVEREGRLGGTDLSRVPALVAAADGVRLTVAGGVTTADEIAALDRMGVDAQVGMALYTGRLGLGEAFAAPLSSDSWPTVVCDERGVALGLTWSDRESLTRAIDTGRGVYRSRRRGIWVKGETSGNHQELLRVDVDCDRDALRFTVRQHGTGFCHLATRTCWGPETGLGATAAVARLRASHAPAGSYTRRLLDDPDLLQAKLVEEAGELARASTEDEVAAEAADLFFFATVALARRGVDLGRVDAVLDRRARIVARRPGERKL